MNDDDRLWKARQEWSGVPAKNDGDEHDGCFMFVAGVVMAIVFLVAWAAW